MNFKTKETKKDTQPSNPPSNNKQKGAYFHSAIHTLYFWFHSSAFSFQYPLRMDGFFLRAFFFSFAIWHEISECVCAHFYDYLRNILFDYIGFSLTYSAPFLSLHMLNAHLLQCAPIQTHFTFFFLFGFFFSAQREKIVVFQFCCCYFMALYVNRCCWFFFSFLSKFHWFCLLIVCISFDSPFTAT